MPRLARRAPLARRRGVGLVGAVAAALLVLMTSAGSVAAWPGQAFPVQSPGNRGTEVGTIQLLLRHHGVAAPATGVFDATTTELVKAFEAGAGLTPDGIVDAPLWQRLLVRLEPGATGPAVVALQRQLNEKRSAGLTVDGVFGDRTRQALVTFQRHASISTTGIAGPATWTALLWHFELPSFSATGLCDYSVGNGAANWGTAAAIAQVEAASRIVYAGGYGRVAVGDIGLEHGGNIAGHISHERGLDVDVRPMRRSNDQCTWGTDWRFTSYDRAATRALIKAVRASAPGHVKVIYFNDPVLIKEGLTRWFEGHEDHLHIRYCEAAYAIAAYDC